MQTAKLKYQTFVKYLNELDVENLTNPILRQLVSSITVRTKKLRTGELEKEIFIEWRFLDKTEGQIFWDSESVRHKRWEREHWYRGMTDEEIEEEKERERVLDEIRKQEAQDEALQEAMEIARLQSASAMEGV